MRKTQNNWGEESERTMVWISLWSHFNAKQTAPNEEVEYVCFCGVWISLHVKLKNENKFCTFIVLARNFSLQFLVFYICALSLSATLCLNSKLVRRETEMHVADLMPISAPFSQHNLSTGSNCSRFKLHDANQTLIDNFFLFIQIDCTQWAPQLTRSAGIFPLQVLIRVARDIPAAREKSQDRNG